MNLLKDILKDTTDYGVQEQNYASGTDHGWLLIGERICCRAMGKTMDVDARNKKKSMI